MISTDGTVTDSKFLNAHMNMERARNVLVSNITNIKIMTGIHEKRIKKYTASLSWFLAWRSRLLIKKMRKTRLRIINQVRELHKIMYKK
jgi:hypothetical protein